jgi:hypothetical protein
MSEALSRRDLTCIKLPKNSPVPRPLPPRLTIDAVCAVPTRPAGTGAAESPALPGRSAATAAGSTRSAGATRATRAHGTAWSATVPLAATSRLCPDLLRPTRRAPRPAWPTRPARVSPPDGIFQAAVLAGATPAHPAAGAAAGGCSWTAAAWSAGPAWHAWPSRSGRGTTAGGAIS